MEKKFKVGQRVEVVEGYCNAKVGMTGVIINVLDYDSPMYQVKFDKRFPGGHDCAGHCKYGYGHNLYAEHLKLIEESASTKYKPGDVVTVRSDLTNKAYYMADGKNYMTPTYQMFIKRGQKVKIKSVTKTGKYMIEGSIFPWVDEMFVDESKGEPTYKIGDRVVIGDSNIGGKYKGQIGIIAKFDPTYPYPYGVVESEYNGGACLWCKALGYAPKEEPKKTEPDCKFKVGDRVKIIKDYCNAEVGMVGTLKRKVGRWAVEFPEGFHGHGCGGYVRGNRGHWVPEECMVLYPEFDWEAFKKTKVIVHLDTPEKEKAFLKECEEHGLRWEGGMLPTDFTGWELAKSEYSLICGLRNEGKLTRGSVKVHCGMKPDAVVYEYELPAVTEPVKTWELVIRGEGDKTTAEYIVNDVKTTAEVRRFHEDQYSVRKAVEFVTNKVLPEEKWVVGVKFDKGEKVYNYYTTDNTVKAGDKVVVPTGKDNHHVAVTVVDIKPEADCKLTPTVLRNMKYVDRKCTEEDTSKYYNGKVVCVKSDTEHWTVGKIYEIKDGMVKTDTGMLHPRVGVPYQDVNDIRHMGCRMWDDPRHNPKNEFIPIVE